MSGSVRRMQRPDQSDPPAPTGSGLDIATIALLVYFVALILIVAALLLLPLIID